MSSPGRIKPVGKAAYTLHLSEHAEAVIGDAKQDTFQPVVTLSKWNGEVSLKLTLDPGKTAPEMLNARLDGDKVKCTVDQGEVHVYPLLPTPEFEEGGLEIMFVLDKKHESNQFTFQVETSNLEFHFQPELTIEEKMHGLPGLLGCH
jgi:hypothetical protein